MNRINGLPLFVTAVTLAVVAVIAAAIAVLGSPTEQRRLRLDERRVADLVGIKHAVTFYVAQHHALPADLAVVSAQSSVRVRVSDPETDAPYEYAADGEQSYRLCAVFARRSEGDQAPPPYFNETGWAHGAGRQCFEQTVAAQK